MIIWCNKKLYSVKSEFLYRVEFLKVKFVKFHLLLLLQNNMEDYELQLPLDL